MMRLGLKTARVTFTSGDEKETGVDDFLNHLSLIRLFYLYILYICRSRQGSFQSLSAKEKDISGQ